MKKMMMGIVLCGVLILCGCGKKVPAVLLTEASCGQVVTDGLGLSEKEFFRIFYAEDRENWTKKEGEEAKTFDSPSPVSYIQYEIPDGGAIAGEESSMTLRFYQKGLGTVSWSGSRSGMDGEEMYTAIDGLYRELKEAFGEADDPSWEEWTDADSFGAAMEEKASQNPGQDFIWTANRWVTASRINDDPYDQYVSLTLMFNWPATGKATGKANGNAELQWTVSAVRDAS